MSLISAIKNHFFINKRAITRHQLGAKNGFRSVSFYESQPFLSLLQPNDRLGLFTAITKERIEPLPDCRTRIVVLDQPLCISGGYIKALRLKGVLPVVNPRPVGFFSKLLVQKYDEGKGLRRHEPLVIEQDLIMLRKLRYPNEYTAKGTMTSSELRTEVGVAQSLGEVITDPILGFGFYDKIGFKGHQVGFAVYGMNRIQDNRLMDVLKSRYLDEREARSDDLKLVGLASRKLRAMHNRGWFHGCPHMWNVALNDDASARIVDLETAFGLFSLPPERRAAFLYLEFHRPLLDLLSVGRYVPEGSNGKHRYDKTRPFMPFALEFIRQYFSAEKGAAFLGRLDGLGDGNFTSKEWALSFPEYQKAIDRSPLELIEPVHKMDIMLATEDRNMAIVDINEFNGVALQMFYRLIKEAVENISTGVPTP